MSYCRFSEADAYIYDDIYQGIVCCACHLMYDGEMSYDKHMDIDWPVLKNFVAGYEDAMKDCNMTYEDFKKRNEEWNEIMKAMNINRQP